MTWEAYWAPNLLNWILGSGIGAVASVVVGVLVRRWLKQLFGEQQRTTELVAGAGVKAEAAVGAAEVAAAQGVQTRETVQQNHVDLTESLLLSQGQVERMARRMDDLLAAYLRLASVTDGRVRRLEEHAAEQETGQHVFRRNRTIDTEQDPE